MNGKLISDTANSAVKLAETAIKKVWSLMDAASEKESPSEYLSPNAIKAIQGLAQPVEQK